MSNPFPADPPEPELPDVPGPLPELPDLGPPGQEDGDSSGDDDPAREPTPADIPFVPPPGTQ